MVAAYNLPTLTSGDESLVPAVHLARLPAVLMELIGILSKVLSGEVLARIYLGEIRLWNDSAIAALNPDLAAAGKLPSQPILLSSYPDRSLEVTQALISSHFIIPVSTYMHVAYQHTIGNHRSSDS
jgi:hypothetical protein